MFRSNGGDATAKAIGERFSQLEELNIEYAAINSTGLDAIGRGCPQLSKLVVTGCMRVTDDATTAIVRCFFTAFKLALKNLHLAITPISTTGLEYRGKGCALLCVLNLRDCPNNNSARTASICNQCRKLNHLWLPQPQESWPFSSTISDKKLYGLQLQFNETGGCLCSSRVTAFC